MVKRIVKPLPFATLWKEPPTISKLLYSAIAWIVPTVPRSPEADKGFPISVPTAPRVGWVIPEEISRAQNFLQSVLPTVVNSPPT